MPIAYDKVIFRVWQGDVIALFPQIPGTPNPSSCLSYMHMGQHSSADYNGIILTSRPAKKKEYAALFAELTKRGYKLKVACRASRRDYEIRGNSP
jgi:hypothetical protein